MSLRTAFDPPAPPAESRPVIQLDGVTVRYRSPLENIASFKEYAIRWLKREIAYEHFTALKGINLQVAPGEILGIIGPNGAGKSTLLKVIARVLRPTEGRVRIRGRISPLLELGAGFDSELTGRENVYLNSAILGFSKSDIDRRFDRIVAFAGLEEFIDAPLRTYSTGMAARLGFAVATDVQPEILIVDEILGVGDAEFQRRSFERIQSFQANGSTILLVTHSLNKVREMCSRVIWLDQGDLVMEGDAEQVVGQYLEQSKKQEEARLQRGQASSQSQRMLGRWGNHKAEIVGVRIENAHGEEQHVFKTGDELRLRLRYRAHEPISDAVFGMAVHRNDGVHVTGPNTQFAGLKIPVLTGEGEVLYRVQDLPLLDGLYYVSVALVNEADTEMYDYHDRLYPFRIENGQAENIERYGLVTLRGEWQFLGGGSANEPEDVLHTD